MTVYSTRRPSPRPRPRGHQDTTATVPVPARTAAHVAQELRNPAAGDPPTFREVAARLGWDEAAARVNRWAAAGYEGDWQDAEFDQPSPRDDQPDTASAPYAGDDLVRCSDCRDLAVSHGEDGCEARSATPTPCVCRRTQTQVIRDSGSNPPGGAA